SHAHVVGGGDLAAQDMEPGLAWLQEVSTCFWAQGQRPRSHPKKSGSGLCAFACGRSVAIANRPRHSQRSGPQTCASPMSTESKSSPPSHGLLHQSPKGFWGALIPQSMLI